MRCPRCEGIRRRISAQSRQYNRIFDTASERRFKSFVDAMERTRDALKDCIQECLEKDMERRRSRRRR